MQRQKYPSYRDEVLNLELARIALLEDGWYDGQGTKYAGADLDLAGDFLDAVLSFDSDLPAPSLIPTPDGCLRAEWLTQFKEAILLLDFRPPGVYGLATTNETPARIAEEAFPFDPATGALPAALFLRKSLTTVPRADTSAYKEEGA